MKVQRKKAVVETFDEAVFDAFGGGPQQGVSMREIGACIGGDVKNAGNTAGREKIGVAMQVRKRLRVR
ncbi:hypothetical protein MASR2M16_18270 [Thauera terpenica]